MRFVYPKAYLKEKEKFKLFEYLSAQDREHFSCAQCKDILQEPYQTHCGYRFCRNCLGKCKDICPGCLKTIDTIHRNENFTDKATEKEIMELKIHCLNGSCEYICKLRYLNDHIQECHSNFGEYSRIVCPYQCNEEVQDNINMHLEKCKRMIVKCPMNVFGCTKLLPREKMDDHVKNDVNYHISLMMAELVKIKKDNESIKEINSQGNHRKVKEIEDLKKEIVGKEMEINKLIAKWSAFKKTLGGYKQRFANVRTTIKVAIIINSTIVGSLIDYVTLPGYKLSFNLSLTDLHTNICISMTIRRSDSNYQEAGLLKAVGIKWRRFDSVKENHWCYLSDIQQGHMSKVIELTMATNAFLQQNSPKNNISFILEVLDVPVMSGL